MIIKTTQDGSDTIEVLYHEDRRIVLDIKEYDGKRQTFIELSANAAQLLVLDLKIAIRETARS